MIDRREIELDHAGRRAEDVVRGDLFGLEDDEPRAGALLGQARQTADRAVTSSRLASAAKAATSAGVCATVVAASAGSPGQPVPGRTGLVNAPPTLGCGSDPPAAGATSQRASSAASSAVSVGVVPTRIPRASSACFFASAVPEEPEMIAPACPIVFPGGAVKPAM